MALFLRQKPQTMFCTNFNRKMRFVACLPFGKTRLNSGSGRTISEWKAYDTGTTWTFAELVVDAVFADVRRDFSM
jgi:hypothetical protein